MQIGKGPKDELLIGSGAISHMTAGYDALSNIRSIPQGQIVIANLETLSCREKG